MLIAVAWRVVGILQTRLRKAPDRRRPHYPPAARFEILEVRNLLGWNQTHTADEFLVSVQIMARFGFGGAEVIGAHLTKAGFKIAEKTVPQKPSNPGVANFVHHVWMMDVTEFKDSLRRSDALPRRGFRSLLADSPGERDLRRKARS